MITFPSYANLGANDLRWKASNPIINFLEQSDYYFCFSGNLAVKQNESWGHAMKGKWIVRPSPSLGQSKAQAWSTKISKSTPVPKQLFLNRKSLYFLIETAPACGGGSTWEQHYAATLEQNTCLSKNTCELLGVFDMEVSKSSLFAIVILRKIIQLRTES